MNLHKIALVTTVSNTILYKQTVKTFPKNIDIIAIDGSKGLFGIESIKFMFNKLSSRQYTWIIMADEDVLFINPLEIFNIIKKLSDDKISVCGIRDGGILPWRDKNPYLINPFFCIVNFEKIKAIYCEKEINENQILYEDEFNDDLSSLLYSYDKESLFEEYYCFFLWLRRKKIKFHFLDAVSNTFENDGETTTVFDLEGEKMLVHTWYARLYGKDDFHTKRIDKVIALCDVKDGLNKIEIIYLRDYKYNLRRVFRRIKNKFINKLNSFLNK